MKHLITLIAGVLVSIHLYAQTTSLVGTTSEGTRKGIAELAKAKDRDCRWKAGPESVRPEKLSPEVLNFVGQDDGPKVKRLCQGTIECDIKGQRWHSDLYLVCGMREANCDSARKCWNHYLEDRLAFLEKGAVKAPTKAPTKAPAAPSTQSDGRD